MSARDSDHVYIMYNEVADNLKRAQKEFAIAQRIYDSEYGEFRRKSSRLPRY